MTSIDASQGLSVIKLERGSPLTPVTGDHGELDLQVAPTIGNTQSCCVFSLGQSSQTLGCCDSKQALPEGCRGIMSSLTEHRNDLGFGRSQANDSTRSNPWLCTTMQGFAIDP
jgi:hypothetical protein